MKTLDVAVVGAGFGGLYMLHALRERGFSVRVYEAAEGVGGTWYWNRYPGARCDVESMQYSYSFSEQLEQEWKWSERYSGQPEILRYLNHVADRFDLRRDIQLSTRIDSARYDEAQQRWRLTSEHGELIDAQFCIMATGCLSVPRTPSIEGLQSFAGRVYHTGSWPHEPVDFSGQRVAVIGTGSSGIQAIPVIARQAAQLHVLQRTPNFSVPAQNRPLDPALEADVKARYRELREEARNSPGGTNVVYGTKSALEASEQERQQQYDALWGAGSFSLMFAFTDLLLNRAANDTAADYVRGKIRELVRDPQTAALLSPSDHPLGTKRICVDTDYYSTFNMPHVTLHDARSLRVERGGVRVGDELLEVDSLVLATGFDAMTGALLHIDIQGPGGSLRDKWQDGPRSYLGLAIEGFPNLFTITGPGSPSVLTNMVTSIEHHVEWLLAAVEHCRSNHVASMEPTREAEDAWVEHVLAVADMTLYPQANSWYMGANVPGKPRVFMPYVGGLHRYIAKCSEVAAHDYEGFTQRPPRFAAKLQPDQERWRRAR